MTASRFAAVALILTTGCRDQTGKDSGDVGEDSTGAEVDRDEDGYPESLDCDDGDAAIHPGAPELCDFIDNDCNGVVDDNAGDATTWHVDTDGDGYGGDGFSMEACEQPSGTVDNNADCNDTDADIHPDADEVCDGKDNNCDGATDDDSAIDVSTWVLDEDGDGYGGSGDSTESCTQPPGYVLYTGDCDDTDARFNPAAIESDCSDSNDYNCDGSVGYADADGDGWAACEECDDSDAAVNENADEICDGIDNDCDGDIDQDATDATTWYGDADNDGHGGTQFTEEACDMPSGYVASSDDCNDVDASAYPGAQEICDLVDNDCDTDVDEGVLLTWYADADGDGYGDPTNTTDACTPPPGYESNGNDCNDSNATASPAALERCDGVDNDCDGDTDEADAIDTETWYADSDGDGYGSPLNTVEACDEPTGFVESSTDCNDADTNVSPAATESCDGVDNDCDGATDETDASDASTWFQDLDGDGYGSVTTTEQGCTAPSGFVADSTDCNDLDSSINIASAEVCDAGNEDEDCDGSADDADPEGATGTTLYFPDGDGDGYGDLSDAGTGYCDNPGTLTTDNTDCDDSTTGASVNPGATETWYDGTDSDCDGASDYDADGDGYESNQYSGDDCDDTNATSTIVATDADCDGTLTANDCDDTTATSTIVATDADCDGTLTAEDCDDTTATSTIVATDADCDGILTTEDCNDNDSNTTYCISCDEILGEGISAGDGAYTIDPDGVSGSTSAFSVYCDMTTVSGGWTLVAKLTGQSTTGNRTDTTFWRGPGYTGDTSNLNSEDALGTAYETVSFSDVLVRGLSTADRHIAWSHSTTYTSMFTVVDAGNRIDDGVLLSGSLHNLDYASYPDSSHHNDCSTLKYGFFGYDHTQTNTGIVGHSLTHGHGGGVVSASNFSTSPSQTNCISDWSFGGGYTDMNSTTNSLNIQAHWWGHGNTYTHDFNAHGLFVR